MKKKNLLLMAGVVSSMAAGLAIGCKTLNKREEKDPELGVAVNDNNGKLSSKATFYEKYVKRGMDVVLSFFGIIILAPVIAVASATVYMEDAGNVIFKQKRVGINKSYFYIHKLRSMRLDTPDIPTHLMNNPEQYILKTGKIYRKLSIDELYQLFDILRGRMSIVGPRPALWNQDDLVAERDKYNANSVKPGLTGLAQISGRDELSIETKSMYDGIYCEKLRKSSWSGFKMDCKCFFGTIKSVMCSDGVIEGAAGKASESKRCYTDGKTDEELIGNIGFGDTVAVSKSVRKKVLITGTNSYIGQSFMAYAKIHYAGNFVIDEVDMTEESWKDIDFSGYDAVYHVAGLAHADVGNVSEELKQKYYSVNTDLAIETAKKAKADGVREFIFMSSMIVYGESSPYGKRKVIDGTTVPKAANFYGDSKLQADVAVRELADDNFKVIVLRPPMIYGRGSKGNYPVLAKLAKKVPVFPDVYNQRSMLYIENLCEFLCQILLIKQVKQNATVLIPQNAEWARTSEMVKEIAKISGRNMKELKSLRAAVAIGGKIPGKIGALINKAFGNSCYAHEMSQYRGLNYQWVTLKESIARTESKGGRSKKKVLFLVNHDVVIYNFRLEIVERLIADGYEVFISSPYGERIDDLKRLGCHYCEIEVERHGMNPIHEIELLQSYKRLMAAVKPDIVLGFTIKPNIYGAMVAAKRNIPFVANVTGLGMAVENPGMTQKAMIALYKFAFRKIQRVFFQNTENRQFFIDNNIAISKHKLLPGSGVNLDRFNVKEYPENSVIRFAFISRIMKEKGIDQYLDVAKAIKQKYSNTEFHICGFCEAEYEGKLEEYNNNGTVIYHGMIRDVAEFLSDIHCVIHPTYYPEGLSNVLLEASASGRPIITTDRSGCREVIDDGVNGYMIPQKDSKALISAVDKFMQLSYEEKKIMGIAGRHKVEKQFDRQIVVEAYMKEITGGY